MFKFFIISILIILLLLILYLVYFLKAKSIATNFEGTDRSYLVYSSQTKDVSPKPLIVVLHGYGDNPRLIEFYSGFSALARKENFIVVYPRGSQENWKSKLSWNAGSCCNPALKDNVNDVAFIKHIIDEVKKTYPVDNTKVYMTGYSNGGMMTHRFAAEMPDELSAIAVVGGSVGGKVDVNKDMAYYNVASSAAALPVLIVHGEEDVTVPFNGGDNKSKDAEFSSVEESVSFWRTQNLCSDEVVTEENDVYTKRVYKNCKNSNYVEAVIVKNNGHMWFGSIQDKILKPFQKHFSTSEEIWKFFAKK